MRVHYKPEVDLNIQYMEGKTMDIGTSKEKRGAEETDHQLSK